MPNLFKDIDSKTITTGGGILLAAFCIYVMWDTYNTGFRNLTTTVYARQDEELQAKNDLTKALTQNAAAIEGNTKVMEQVLRQRP